MGHVLRSPVCLYGSDGKPASSDCAEIISPIRYMNMHDNEKSKAQLIKEMTDLRRRMKALEASETRRLEAEAKLSSSELNYQQLFSSNPDAIILVDSEDRMIVDANPAACKLYGYSLEEMLTFRATALSAEKSKSEAHISQVLSKSTGASQSVTRQHIKKDGTVFTVEIRSGFYYVQDRELICAIIRDVTDRIEANKVLSRSNAYMRALHQASLGLMRHRELKILLQDLIQHAAYIVGTQEGYIFMHDPVEDELVIQYGIGRFEQHIGFRMKPGEGLAGKVWQSGKPLKINRYGSWSDRHPFEAWDDMGFDVGIPLKTGSKLIGVIGLCSFDQKKKIGDEEIAILSSFAELASIIISNVELHSKLRKELNERIEIEKSLSTSRQTLNTVLDSVDATVYVSDLDTYEVLFMNQHMEEQFGGNFEGHPCYKSFRGADQPCEHCKNHRLLNEYGQPAGVVIWEGKNPITGKWYINYDRAIKWIDGRYVKLQIATDITKMKQMEADRSKMAIQLQQAQKMEAIGVLAGGIAHDFNNILQVISGFTQLMLLDIPENQVGHNRLQEIEKASIRAKDLVRQILTFSRKIESHLEPINLNDEIVQIRFLLERTIPKMISIELHLAADLQKIEADPNQVKQILMNLTINAHQAMPEGGRLAIETRNVTLDQEFCDNHLGARTGKYVMLVVSDTGVGMDHETRERIFEPFFTTKQVNEGTGLGLATVYGIVKTHGGYITCYSEPGFGTTFKLYFPASSVISANIHQEGFVDKVEGGAETILVVDDDDAVLKLGEDILLRFGYRVLTAGSGEEALALFSDTKDAIDLIILDLNMPGMGGLKCLQEIRNIDSKAKILIASGYSPNGSVLEIIGEDTRRFIGKPFQVRDLLKKVRDILEVK